MPLQSGKFDRRKSKFIMRKILTVFIFEIAILSSQLGWANPPKSPPQVAPTWATETSLQCAAVKVQVATTCSEIREGVPYCKSQTVKFTQGAKATAFDYAYGYNDGSPAFITKVSCFEKEHATYVFLDRTNFGNCAECEWEDVFSGAGEYLGSQRGLYQSEKMTSSGKEILHKDITKNAAEVLRAISEHKIRALGTSDWITRARN
jgi:hypothetical protein